MKDICPACGKQFENYEPPFSLLCCNIACEIYLKDEDNKYCKHSHVDFLCQICEDEKNLEKVFL